MAVMNMVQAIGNALSIKLAEDHDILLFGEDAGKEGGVFRVTENLQQQFGEARVFDTPLAESGIVGTAVGMCMVGLRPVVEIQFSGFIFPAFNQIVSHVARLHNRSRGRYKMRMVIRMPWGGGIKAAEHHSESIESFLAPMPGLKIVIPSTPYDAKGLLISALESDDPVIFFEPTRLYRAVKQEVPEAKFALPMGKAKVLQEGKHITIVSYGGVLREVQKAAVLAKKQGVAVEIIDLRTIVPLDRDTIANSVRKTGRFLCAVEGPGSFGVAAELMSIVVEDTFLSLEAPPTRLAGFDTIVPYPKGEHHYFYSAERVFYEIKKLVEY